MGHRRQISTADYASNRSKRGNQNIQGLARNSSNLPANFPRNNRKMTRYVGQDSMGMESNARSMAFSSGGKGHMNMTAGQVEENEYQTSSMMGGRPISMGSKGSKMLQRRAIGVHGSATN